MNTSDKNIPQAAELTDEHLGGVSGGGSAMPHKTYKYGARLWGVQCKRCTSMSEFTCISATRCFASDLDNDTHLYADRYITDFRCGICGNTYRISETTYGRPQSTGLYPD